MWAEREEGEAQDEMMRLAQVHDRRRVKNHQGTEYDLINEDDRVYGINTIGYPTKERPASYHREVDSHSTDVEIEAWFEECRTTIGEAAETEAERTSTKRLIYTWRDIFGDNLRNVPECRIAVHYIQTYPGSIPHKATNPLYTAEEMAWMRENLPKMCDSGILTVSNSQWSSKPKFVRRKNGSLRMVHVFCRLNKATIKFNTPMKRIEPILHNLMQSRFKCYWQADASVGYWGVPLAREHAYKTAFNTPLGQFCYLRMGMGLSGAAHTYARMKDILTGPIPSPLAEAAISGSGENSAFEYFMDDDYGAHTSFESQYQFLHEKYFPRIAWSGLKLNPAKSHFWSRDLKLLGFAGSGGGGLRPSIDKMAAIRDYPIPNDVPALERFLHISTYLRQWVPGRSDHAKILKTAILYNMNSIGAVLFQLEGPPPGTVASLRHRENEQIILFISKALAPAETRYHTTEREALAVVRALSEVRWLVLGSPYPIKMYTDRQALLSVLKGDEAKGRIARWQMRLAEYDMEIYHVPGAQNVIADGMSRLITRREGEEIEVAAVDTEGWKEEWKEWLEDEWYGVILAYKLTGRLPTAEIAGKAGKDGNELSETDKARWSRRLKHQSARFVIIDPETPNRPRGLLYLENNGEAAICIRKRNIKEILYWAHDVHGHFAESITLKKLIGKYYWPTRHRDTSYYCRSCDSCQRVGPLKPSQALLPIFQLQPMDLWGMDFIGPIAPISRSGNRYILIVVDYFTRYLFTSAVARADSAAVVALLSEIGKYIGWPRAIYNDNGSHFVNASVKQLLDGRGVKQFPAPKSHPQSVGLAERYVQLVVVELRTLMATSIANRYIWDEMLPGVTHAINTRVIRAHGYTPSQLLFGFNLRRSRLDTTPRDQLASAVISEAIVEVVEQYTDKAGKDNTPESDEEPSELWAYHQRLSKIEEICETVRTKTLDKCSQAQKKTRWKSPQGGDLVLLRRFEIDRQHGRKFEAKWEGPYKLDKISWHGRTGRVFDLITGEEARVKKAGLHERVHLDDLKVFIPREDQWLGFEEDRQEQGNLKFVGLCEALGKDEEEGVREWGDRTVIFPGGEDRWAAEE